MGGVGARPQGSVAGVGEAAAQRAAAGRRVCGGEQAGALQSCRRHMALAQEELTGQCRPPLGTSAAGGNDNLLAEQRPLLTSEGHLVAPARLL